MKHPTPEPSAVVGLKYTLSPEPTVSIPSGRYLEKQQFEKDCDACNSAATPRHSCNSVPASPAHVAKDKDVAEAAVAATAAAPIGTDTAVASTDVCPVTGLRETSVASGEMLSLTGDEDKGRTAPTTTTVNILNTSYKVTVREGRWWKGCCFRPKVEKVVLQDINVQLRSGELTAILGNSGSFFLRRERY